MHSYVVTLTNGGSSVTDTRRVFVSARSVSEAKRVASALSRDTGMFAVHAHGKHSSGTWKFD